MTDIELSHAELQTRAVEILFRELGPKNAIRFLGLNPNGHGDYTEERRKRYEGLSSDQIAEMIRAEVRNEVKSDSH